MMRPAPPVAPRATQLLASRSIELTAVVPAPGPAKAGHYRNLGSSAPEMSATPVVSGFSRTEPTVVFDRREVAALQRLVTGPVAHGSERPAMDLGAVDSIVITPIAIDPLEPGGQGERQ
jgi:hypothetical protein